ncbi:MAG: NADH:flavin oxidoreductase [Proteobacteria bacterium]|jgi:2,4-dienoyl-CoA reductase-like NADH-dependent reductase (Old Yellow Enzyme family)|nr:NADH:flavin oxidoreductase [Pseudomonadota bacterium]
MSKLLENNFKMAKSNEKGSFTYPLLFSPITINGITIPNRLYFAPLGIDNANLDGTMSMELENFYVGIAKGGCGLIMMSNCSVSPDSCLNPRGLRLYNTSHANSLKQCIHSVESYGGIFGIQLQHYGAQAVTTYTKKSLLSPSGYECPIYKKKDPNYTVHKMTLDDINIVKEQFITSAIMSADSGVKFIQLQASNGYLLHSFISPYMNHRNDEYGGSYENRIRILIEIVQGIKARLKNSIILSVRIGVDDGFDYYGIKPNHFKTIIPLLEQCGVDMFAVTISIAETFSVLINKTPQSHHNMINIVKEIKSYATVPIGFAGFNHSLEDSEKILASKSSDLIGMARALFADNNLILKSIDGRSSQINHCLWDGNCFKDKSNPQLDRVYCCVNPSYKRPESIKYL